MQAALSHIDDDTLQTFFDGELGKRAADEVTAHLRDCADCQARVARLERLSRLIGASIAKPESKELGDALFARVEQGIQTSTQTGFGERLRVVSDEWLTHRRGAVVSITAMLAVAAVVLVVMLSRANSGGTEAPSVAEHIDTPSAPRPAGSSTVVNVDFGAHAGTVFQVAGESGNAVSVVWIDEEPSADEE